MGSKVFSAGVYPYHRTSYIVFHVFSLSSMSYNTVDCISLKSIGVGTHSVYLFVSTIVVWSIWQGSALGRLVSPHGRCDYNAIDVHDIIDVMFVSGDGVRLNSDNAKRFCAARQELVICADGNLMCMLVFGCDKCWSIKKYIINRFVNWNFAYTTVIIVCGTLL